MRKEYLVYLVARAQGEFIGRVGIEIKQRRDFTSHKMLQAKQSNRKNRRLK